MKLYKLYERDYTKINSEHEKKLQEKFEIYDKRKGIKNTKDDPRNNEPEFEDRKFLWCHNSLFPNNYLYHGELEKLDLGYESTCFKDVIDKAKNENEIQRYIKDNRKWFIPASIYKEYNFGNHGAYLFNEMPLGTEYRTDYALLGKSSDGYSLVLIEFEKANVPFKIKSYDEVSESVRKGNAQIRAWKKWFDSNRGYFLKSIGFTEKGIDIPTSRIYYCLVVSRRDLMNDVDKDLRSDICFEMNNTKILSFDRLVDNILKLNNGY